ncbi:MAG: AtpZ/AtpI family protein [Hyphomicrobiaceae bacterium]|nr:AtpZ/AtpI family protein [Hyphomicrobiaceae bacterium]
MLSPKDREDLSKRSNELGQKIETYRRWAPNDAEPRSMRRKTDKSAASQALKIATELVVGVCIGFLIGYQLDHYLGTSSPWFLVTFVIVGFAAGMSNVVRIAKRIHTQTNLHESVVLTELKSNNGAKT